MPDPVARLVAYKDIMKLVGAPKRRTRPRPVIFGHSFAASEVYMTSSYDGIPANANFNGGAYEWARARSMGALAPLALNDNYAVGGTQSAAHLTQLQTILSVLGPAAADALLIGWTGTNDLGTLAGLQALKLNVAAMIDLVAPTGGLLVLFTVLARGIFTPTQHQWAGEYNRWLRQYVRDFPFVILVDVAPQFVDMLGTGYPVGGAGTSETLGSTGYVNTYTLDGTHLASRGASLVGQAFLSAITHFLYPFVPYLTSPADIWSADNPFGVLNSNGNMAGSGGFLTSATGQVATGFNLTNDAAASTVTASKTTTLPGGLTGEGQRIVIAAGGTGLGALRFYENIPISKIPPGSSIYMAELIRYSKTVGLLGATTQLIDYVSTPATKVMSMVPRILNSGGVSGWQMPLFTGQDLCNETQKFTTSGSSTQVRAQTTVYWDMATVDADLTIAARAVRFAA